jgi:hypothetical protein
MCVYVCVVCVYVCVCVWCVCVCVCGVCGCVWCMCVCVCGVCVVCVVCEHTVSLTDRLPLIIYADHVETYSLPHSTSYRICNSGRFLGSKAAGACRWSLTFIQYRDSKFVMPHLHSTACFISKQKQFTVTFPPLFPAKQSAFFLRRLLLFRPHSATWHCQSSSVKTFHVTVESLP